MKKYNVFIYISEDKTVKKLNLLFKTFPMQQYIIEKRLIWDLDEDKGPRIIYSNLNKSKFLKLMDFVSKIGSQLSVSCYQWNEDSCV